MDTRLKKHDVCAISSLLSCLLSPPSPSRARARARAQAYHFVQDSLTVLADGSAHSNGVVWGFIGCLGTLTLLQVSER